MNRNISKYNIETQSAIIAYLILIHTFVFNFEYLKKASYVNFINLVG